ncbi:MAG: sugar O-acetyltransferase, partial [Lentisphaeria bacterium]
MELQEYLDFLNSGETVECGSAVHLKMSALSQEALKITAILNSSYHEPAEIRELMEQLTGREIDES